MRHRILVLFALAAAAGCTETEAARPPPGQTVAARRAADMIHAALAADRAVYAKEIVARLTILERVRVVDPERGQPVPLEAREDWRSQHGKLPLPAQMLRMSADLAIETEGLSYLLLSPWPINKQNRPRTALEKSRLAEVVGSGRPVYGTEELDGRLYFAAIYPDVAVSDACVSCHNRHPDSPRRDFRAGDVLGGLVVRFPL